MSAPILAGAIVCPHCAHPIALAVSAVHALARTTPATLPDLLEPPGGRPTIVIAPPFDEVVKRMAGVAAGYRADGQTDRAEGIDTAINMLTTQPHEKRGRHKPASPLLDLPDLVAQSRRSKAAGVRAVRAALSNGGPLDPLTATERAILTALVRVGRPLSLPAVLLFAGLRPGGHVNKALASLRRAEFLEGSQRALSITGDGVTTVGAVEPMPGGAALLDSWVEQLGGEGATSSRMLRSIEHNHPRDLDTLLARLSLNPGGHINKALSVLRKLHLVMPRGLALTPEFRSALEEKRP